MQPDTIAHPPTPVRPFPLWIIRAGAPVLLARNTTWTLGSLSAGMLLFGGLYARLRLRRLVGMRARDMVGRIICVNPALREMTGYSAAELISALTPYP